jgi:multidrug efflux pump subunit AcrB
MVFSLGVLTYFLIPRLEDPLIKVNGATVQVVYPGAGPRDVERYVTKPLENKINEIDQLDKITSTSAQGTALIMLEFDSDSDMDQNMQKLREKVREAQSDLPQEAQDPEITRWKTETVSLILNLSGPFSYRQLHRYAKFIKRDLEKIPEIMTLEIDGHQDREIHVEVDEARLSQFKISLNELVHSVRDKNVSLPGGNMDIGKKSYLVRTVEEFESAAEIGQTIIGSYRGRPVFLKDLAHVRDTYEDPEYLVRFDGQKSVNILVTPKPRANLLAASKAVGARLQALSGRLPAQLKVTTFADQSISVSGRLANFRNNLIMGAGLVMVATILLMNARMAFTVAILIPLSIAFALSLLHYCGQTLNQITLTSLVLVLGMLVDNGIVVVENIQRHLSLGKERLVAALDGSREVLGAITSSTATTVLAFTPLLFMSGHIGQFIRGIPLTMIFALIGSLLIAVFVSPLLSYRLLKKEHKKTAKDGGIIRIYSKLLQFALSHKAISLGAVLAAFVGSLVMIPRLGLQFFPKAEKDLFVIEATLPQGTNIQATLAVADHIEELVLANDQVAHVMSHVGRNGPRIYYNINTYRTKESRKAQFMVSISKERRKATTARIIEQLRPQVSRIAGARIEIKELEQGPPVGAPVALKIKGDDVTVLRRVAQQVKALLENVTGAVDVTDDASETSPQIRVLIDSDKARLLGITNTAIANTMRTGIYGTTATSFRREDEEIDVVVSLGGKAQNDLGTFDRLYLKSMQGFKTPFRQVADLRLISDIGTIQREDLTRTVTVRSEVQGVLPEAVVDALKAKMAAIDIPPGYLVAHEGETKERTESFMSLGWAMMAAVILVYIVLVAQFNSYRQPIIIALSLPFGLVGAVLGLVITGYPFGFMAFLGVVSLTGIVVNDAIVLIDFINVKRSQGVDVRTAVLEAGKVRFRPVMLTTISTVGGLLPLAVRGGSLWGPMGNVIIFGLGMATILTLILIPIIYEILENTKPLKSATRTGLI